MLPTLGRARVPDGSEAILTVSGLMRATIRAETRTVVMGGDAAVDAAGWEGCGGCAWAVAASPWTTWTRTATTAGAWPVRLREAEAAHWQHTLGQAWNLLSVHHPGYAAALQAGVASLVPITLRAGQKNVSATSGDAFGAVAASRPSDGAALALP